jgi:hypothetical protein
MKIPDISESNQAIRSRDKRKSRAEDTSALLTTESAKSVSEEDVFARLVNDEVQRTLGAEGKARFDELVQKQLQIRTRSDGSVNLEKVYKGALKWASNEKHSILSRDSAQQIYSNTFNASQLDNNHQVLDDASVKSATAESSVAFEKARVSLEMIVSNQQTAPVRDLMERATASPQSRFYGAYNRRQSELIPQEILFDTEKDFTI